MRRMTDPRSCEKGHDILRLTAVERNLPTGVSHLQQRKQEKFFGSFEEA